MKRGLLLISKNYMVQYRYLRILFTATLLLCILFNTAFAQKTWIGQGVGGGTGTDFNTASNWSPAAVPTATDDVIIAFNNTGTINLSANASIKNLTITISGANNSGILNVFNKTLIVNGATNVDILSGNPSTQLVIGVNDATSAGTIDFVGNAVFGTTNKGNGVFLNANVNSTFIFRANLIRGTKTAISLGSEPGTVIFDGVGIQNFTADDNLYICNFKNVIIGSTNNPTVNLIVGLDPINDDILGNLTINGSATLNIGTSQWNRSTAGGILSVKNTGTLRLAKQADGIGGSNFPANFLTNTLDSTSTVEFYGTIGQTIPGVTQLVNSYGNLTLTNSNTKTIGSNINVFRNLTIGANTTMALGNFNATLKSNNQTTAYVSAVPTTAAITYGTGRFEIERYLPAYKAWRFLATPIQRLETDATSPTISAAWREGNSAFTSTGYGTQITGPVGTFGSAGSLDASTQRGSLKTYDATTNKYIEIVNANTTLLANKEGHYIFVRGDRGVAVGGTTGLTTLRMKGKILTGDQTFTVPVIAGGAFQSFGNPYPSRINFSTVILNSPLTINKSYYVWNPNPIGTIYAAGKFEVYIDFGDGNYRLGNATGPIRNYIESGQAVFIQSITGGSITVKEADKFGGSSLVSRVGGSQERAGVTLPTLEINLHTNDVNGNSILADAAVVNFDNSFSNALDNMDVKKISNTSDNLSILNNAQNLVVERRSNLVITDTIKLNINGMRVASYRFEINPSVLENTGLIAFLKDKFLQTETPISLTNITNINFDVTNNAASYATDRFMIVFKAAPIYSSTINKILALRNANKSVLINWDAVVENNVTNQRIEKSNDGLTFAAIENKLPENNGVLSSYNYVDVNASAGVNYYRIKSIRANGSFVYSEEANVKALEDLHEITVTPNPVEGKTIHFTLNNLPLGKYDVQIINTNGSKIFSQSLNHTSENNLYKVKIDNVVTGKYEMILFFEEKSYSISLFIK